MQIQIRWSDIEKSEALAQYVREQVEHAVRHHQDQLTRIDVHLHDENAEKSGANDKRCVIEARPTGADPLIVEGTGDDFYKTVNAVAKKLERAVRTFADKRRKH